MSFSFVTTLKPFDSKYKWDWHQRSALYSWTLAKTIDTVVVGIDCDEGLKTATQLGFKCIPQVTRAFDLGYYSKVPLLTEVLREGVEHAKNDWICYINSDIILTPKIESQLSEMLSKIDINKHPEPFITVRRRDFEMKKPVQTKQDIQDIEEGSWNIHPVEGSDIFITTKEFWRKCLTKMPSFLIGRFSWDNYFHYLALQESSLPVEATNTVICYHPNHGREGADPRNPELMYNLQLYHASIGRHIYTLDGSAWLRI